MDRTRLATPGVVLIIAGVILVYWGMGIFRGETSGVTKRNIRDIGARFKDDEEISSPNDAPRGSGSDSKLL